MKAIVTLKNLNSRAGEEKIVRNLRRIMDIVIIDVDIDKGVLCFLYNSQQSFFQVKSELARIGYPIKGYTPRPYRVVSPRSKGNRTISTS